MSANRCGTVATVKCLGSQSATSSHRSGVETRASGRGPHRVRRRDRAVFGVLVEVDEHALAFLLPPAAGGQLGRASLDFPRHRLGGQPHLPKRPARHDARIDVEAARPRRLRPRGQPVVLEHLAGHLRDVEDLPPRHAGHRVEVDAEFVGVVEVVGEHRMRVEVDAAQVDRPRQAGRVVDDGLFGRGARTRTAVRRRRPSRAASPARVSGRRPPRSMPLTNRFRIIGRPATPRRAPSATAR